MPAHHYIEIPFALPPGVTIILDATGSPRLRANVRDVTWIACMGVESALRDATDALIADYHARNVGQEAPRA